MIARSKAMTLIDEQRPQFIKHHLMFLRFLMCHCPQLYHSYYSARRGLVVVDDIRPILPIFLSRAIRPNPSPELLPGCGSYEVSGWMGCSPVGLLDLLDPLTRRCKWLQIFRIRVPIC